MPPTRPKKTAPKSVTVIFNPVSGRADPDERKKTISEALAAHGYTCQLIATTPEHGARALTEQAIHKGVDLIAVSGGDGTVMEVLSALVGTDIPVAVLPAGTGNLLSLNLGIPTTVPEAVHVALSGRSYALDLARTHDGRYFAIMGGLGLDAQMIADTDRAAKNQFGKWAYFRAAIKNLPRRRTAVEITVDNRPPLRRRAKTVLIANMGRITAGLDLLPTASPQDGQLDIGIVKAATLAHWVHLMGSALMGRAHQDPVLEVYQARRVTLRTRRPHPVQFDGEDAGRMHELTVEIVPRAVQILLPEDTPAAEDALPLPFTTATPWQSYGRTLPGIVFVPVLAALTALIVWRHHAKRE